jgi:hypothetical protein
VSVGRTIKSYFFWTYERGSFHYDVMVTLILAFIFLTPLVWNYGDHPQQAKLPPSELRVQVGEGNSLVYEVPSPLVHPKDAEPIESQLENDILPVSGVVTIDRYALVKDPSGHVTAYRVWAHR